MRPWRAFWRGGSGSDLDVCLVGKSTIASYVECLEYFQTRGFQFVTMLELSRAPERESSYRCATTWTTASCTRG